MRLPRLTTRRLMVLVAVAALPLGIYAGIEGRRQRLLRLASYHLEQAHRTLRYVRHELTLNPKPRSKTYWATTGHATPRSEWHVMLWQKYRQAARRPWLPVPPDPPPPK